MKILRSWNSKRSLRLRCCRLRLRFRFRFRHTHRPDWFGLLVGAAGLECLATLLLAQQKMWVLTLSDSSLMVKALGTSTKEVEKHHEQWRLKEPKLLARQIGGQTDYWSVRAWGMATELQGHIHSNSHSHRFQKIHTHGPFRAVKGSWCDKE